jgi:ankyrin repeat protein
MKHEKKKLVWLGIFFIAMGSIIYVTQEAQDNTQDIVLQKNSVTPPPTPSLFSPKNALAHLLPLINSESVEKISELLVSLPINQAGKIAEQLINDQSSPLNRDDKIQLLSNLAFLYRTNREKQGKIFKLLIENKLFHEGTPLLFAIASGNYEKIIPDLLEWLEGYNPDLIKIIADDAINYSVEHNKVTEFDRLYNYGIFIPPHQATTLLWETVDRDNDYHFVNSLIKAGADINAVYEKEGKKYTPLIRATELNNIKIVKALLEAGADVNLIPDPAVGSALQIAVVKRFGDIDLLLRRHGARE